MMRRSIPPASAALADRPVPAPPPTMGRPDAKVSASRDNASLRNTWITNPLGREGSSLSWSRSNELVERFGHSPTKTLVVDGGGNVVDGDRGAFESGSDGGEECPVGVRVGE